MFSVCQLYLSFYFSRILPLPNLLLISHLKEASVDPGLFAVK